MVDVVKRFDEPVGAGVRARIAGLTPKHYTRLGAAIRHVSEALEARAASRRLLVVITDGKPNDLDHYEGRHGAEDTRRAVIEARRRGQAVFAITVDNKAREYLPHLFGANGYAVVGQADRLVDALPAIYRQVVGA
jgi:nitric oxide reductase NorD protein